MLVGARVFTATVTGSKNNVAVCVAVVLSFDVLFAQNMLLSSTVLR